jgi:2-polyprenyl-6-methoxyphenol hydroxylase-like FAD-dependent oxidoreductase
MTDRQRLSKAGNGARPIAVIGAGIAGLTLAIRLRQAGHAVSVFEARGREGLSEGAFLTLAPNGVNALRAIGLADCISALGIPTLGFEIMNGKGKRLAWLDETAPMLAAGALSVTLKRADLLGTLCREAETLGAEIHFNHALSGLERLPGGIGLQFANGETRVADWVAGCDGVWSRMRRLAFPGAPDPVYTGLTGTGGFVEVPSIADTDGFMRMVFGDTAFFGYIKEGSGPVFWFDSFALDEDAALAKPDAHRLAALARSLHARDPEPIRRITASVDAIARTYPVFDMQHLPRWHDDRVVLLGDAAHAVSPHAGQGASMAIEDAVVLAACLPARASCGMAFAAFQRLRQQSASSGSADGSARRSGRRAHLRCSCATSSCHG